jgi:predicted Rossmann fold nucleotide-binding protein DprA/Smf involved in DNA uptake
MGERTSSLSAGTNALLRLGAVPVTSAADVLELFDLVPAQAAKPDLGTTAQALLALLGDGPLTADEIARAAEIEAAPLSASLVELELAGRITLEDGVYRAAI